MALDCFQRFLKTRNAVAVHWHSWPGPLPGKGAGRGGRVCVCLSLLSMKYVFFPLPLALLVTVSVCKITISPVEWWGCPNPKFEGMGCCVTFIFVLLCVLLRFCFSVPIRKFPKYIFRFWLNCHWFFFSQKLYLLEINGNVWSVPFWVSFVYGYRAFLISSIW